MAFSPLPVTAAWQHRDARLGFEDLGVERLEQEYVRACDEGRHQRYDYAAPAFDFTACLVYDEAGLVLDYPGIALRAL